MRSRSRIGSCLAILTIVLALTPAQSARGEDAWSLLKASQTALAERGAIESTFEQGFRPAGFSSVDRESGQLSIRLPGCMRWDYEEPFPKVYLLCDDVAWSWNPGESAGVRQRIEPQSQPGLDLLFLDVSELTSRYRAEASRSEGRLEIRLQPVTEGGQIASARLVVGEDDGLLERVEYEDAEGNFSYFDLQSFTPLEDATRFEAPSHLRWEDL